MKSNSLELERVIPVENFLSLTQSNTILFNLSSSSSSSLSFQKNFNLSTIQIDTISSYDPYQHITETIVYKYICLAIFVIGVVGNLLSVLVFSRPSLRHRSCAVYFLALAITDIASLCASFIDTVLPSYNNVTLTAKSLFICKLNPLMVYFTTDLSNFLLAVASIDRAVSIQCPHTSTKFCRARIAIYIIIAMSIMFLIINGHIFWGFEISNIPPSFHGCMPSKKRITYNKGHDSITYDRFYAIFDSLDMLFAVVIPFIVMLVCNIIILIRVITSRRSIRTIITTTIQSKKFRKRHEKEKQLTVMLLGSAAAFLVFTLPTEINDTVRAFRPSHASQTKGAMALLTAIFIAMGQLNHAIHFYIYTLTGGVFRNELIQLFNVTKKKSLSNRRRTTEQSLLHSKSLQHNNVTMNINTNVHEF
ncbi:unnamed protein product [Rotaria sordida]|uniref:G-protein coupled receptors family 1 profile domain-containing protein n=1 Tax=Rotaria sordida TaxID=392033 RepID=A0A814GYX7_9BILA|nr:unnamed protein product [Rotaria sordida]CAF0925165.1 unnamed protein product [Rotaria sordida]CAF0962722.1 unnamed protein product [Rotaria sordida]CAF1002810.1 unnamed protein product [Rotaria sordida]CAF1093074.1 unnamed protein product [Rotaria sordida]